MNRLQTNYLGMALKNPLVPSSSPLTRNLDIVRRMEDYGAAAVVLPSLFEEQVRQEEQQLARFLHEQNPGHGESSSFLPVPDNYQSALDKYLETLQSFKTKLDIPVIASLNGVSHEGWVEFAKELEDEGADALELNIYYIPANPRETSQHIEKRYLDIIRGLGQKIGIPVTVKLPSQLTSVAHFAMQVQECGAKGVSLFNRFYQPDIDPDTLKVIPAVNLSSPQEALLRVRWTAIISSQLDIDIATTGGIHSAQNMAKAILAGACVTHVCSAILNNGTAYIAKMLADFERWMDECEYTSVAEFKGSIRQKRAINPTAYERANYLDVLDSYTPPGGVLY